jgi:hypothetical protein
VGVKTLPEARNPLFHGPLEAKDIALSRRKPGFESRWGHSLQPALMRAFSCQEEDCEDRAYRGASERLQDCMRAECDSSPDHER